MGDTEEKFALSIFCHPPNTCLLPSEVCFNESKLPLPFLLGELLRGRNFAQSIALQMLGTFSISVKCTLQLLVK